MKTQVLLAVFGVLACSSRPSEAEQVAWEVGTPEVSRLARVGLEHVDAEPVDHLEAAWRLEEAGDRAGALVEARRAAHDEPSDLGPVHAVGRLAAATGDQELAAESLMAIAAVVPGEAAPQLELARERLARGESRGALLAATAALVRDPTLPEAYHLRARAKLQLSMVPEAVLDLQRAVALNARHSWALNDLGYALLLDGKPDQALGPLERAAQLAPHLAFVRRNLAVALDRVGREEDARRVFAEADRLDPDSTQQLSDDETREADFEVPGLDAMALADELAIGRLMTPEAEDVPAIEDVE